LATAELAYQAACTADPQNALLLWQRQENLRQAGRIADADELLRQLVNKQWPARFADVQQRARWQLEAR
jgi:hypothetical protein